MTKKATEKMKAAVQAAVSKDEAVATEEKKQTSAKLPKVTAKKATVSKPAAKKVGAPELKPVSEVSQLREVIGQAVLQEEVRANAGHIKTEDDKQVSVPPWEDLPTTTSEKKPEPVQETVKKNTLSEISKKPDLKVENGRISFEDAIKAAARPAVPQIGFDVTKYLK